MEEAYVIAQNTSGAASTSALPFASASTALDAETLLLTTQGDGIHLTAVEDSTPLSSLTLGPSTRFATPAVARRRPNSKECDICSGMLNQPEIWHWRAEMKGDATFVKEPEKRVKKVEKPLIALTALDDASTAAFATLSSTGTISVLDDTLNELAKLSEEQSDTTSTLSGRLEAHRSAGSSSLMLVATRFRAFSKNVQASGKKSKPRKSKPPVEEFARAASLQIISYEGNSIRNIANVVLPEADIIDLSYSHDARLISVLCVSGIWQAYTLSPSNELVPLRQLHLSSSYITFNQPEPSQARSGHLLALHDSFVLLAAAQKSVAEKASLSIWDLRFGVPVCVSETNLTAKFEDICLSQISSSLAAITHKTSSHARAYGLPLTLPAASTLSLVVGKQALAAPFLVKRDPAEEAAEEERKRKLGIHPLSSEAKQQLLADSAASRQTLLSTIRNDPSLNVDDLFEEWVNKETERKEAYLAAKDEIRAAAYKARTERKAILHVEPTGTNKSKLRKANLKWKPVESAAVSNDAIRVPTYAAGLADLELSDDEKERPHGRTGKAQDLQDEADSGSEKEESQPKKPKKRTTERFSFSLRTVKPTLPVNFVSRMLILCLDDARKNKRPIKTLRYLLERRVVSDNAVPGGVTVALQKAQLWPLVSIALSVIVNIPEDVVINLLAQTAQRSISRQLQAQQFARVLTKVVEYPMSARELRRALASNLSLSDTRRAIHLIQRWIEFWNEPTSQPKFYVPELPNILTFLAALVDAHFVNLLQDRAVYEALQQLTRQLTESTEINEDLLLLKGPLDNVKREHSKLSRPLTDAEVARQRLEEEQALGTYSLDVFEV